MPTVLEQLAALFSPRSAEARVTTDDPAMQQLIETLKKGDRPYFPPGRQGQQAVATPENPLQKALQYVVQAVYREAGSEPTTVTLKREPQREDIFAQYRPGQQTIALMEEPVQLQGRTVQFQEAPGALPYQEALGHELIHFLINRRENPLSRFGVDEHAITQYVLGEPPKQSAYYAGAYQESPERTAPFAPGRKAALSKRELALIEKLFPRQPLIEQDIPPPVPSLLEMLGQFFRRKELKS